MSDVLRAADALADAGEMALVGGEPQDWKRLDDAVHAYRAARDAAPADEDDDAPDAPLTAEQYRVIYDDLIHGLATDLGLDPEKAGGGSVRSAVRRLVAGSVSVPQKPAESTAGDTAAPGRYALDTAAYRLSQAYALLDGMNTEQAETLDALSGTLRWAEPTSAMDQVAHALLGLNPYSIGDEGSAPASTDSEDE